MEENINNNINEPTNFRLEVSSIWSFKDRGSWSTHNGSYRGNWSPYVPRNIILRYSNENDIVLDQFVGSGTTIIEAMLLNRKAIGCDINPLPLNLSKSNLKDFNNARYKLYQKDARNLNFIPDNYIDLICTHPPYADIIKYSKSINDDLSLLSKNEFLKEMKKVAIESYRVLKPHKYCAFLIGDMRKNKFIMPLGFELMNVFQDVGFKLKEIIIKEQHNCKMTDFWYDKSIKYNFLLLAHEYLFVFEK